MKFSILALIAATSAVIASPAPLTIPNAPGALTEFNRIITLVEGIRSASNTTGSLDSRGCDRMDPCCPNGGDSCVEDMCSFGDGINFAGCMLGCCVACGKGGRYC